MGKTLRKISSVAVSTITVVSLSGASLLVPAAVLAQASSIEALLQQIAQLQAQLQALQAGGAVAAVGACSFTRDLTVGAKGDDVKCLQTYLTGTGHFTFAGGATGFFGGVTKAAVAAWQTANAVSPAAGYFGAKSRAKYSLVAGAPAAPGAPVVVPGAGLAAGLAAIQPSGSAIAGAGQIDVMKFVLTASAAGGVNVTDLKFSRTGVVSDSNISNLYLADEQGVIFSQYTSLTNGVAQFAGAGIQVGAGQSRTIILRMDLSSSASAGNTLGWKLDEVKTGGPVSGLPVSGPILTVTTVSNPSLATATYTYVSTGGTVDAGTNGFLVHAATVNVTNNASDLKSIKYTLVGSANKADLRNWRLKVSGVEVATVATASGDILTIVPATPVRLPTGNSNVELYVDVMGSPNRTVGVNVLRPYDMVLTDSQYTTNITPSTSGSATSVTINQGRITVSKATDSPTGSVPVGASNVTLGKFTFYAGGEPVKIRYLPITLLNAGDNAAAVSTDLRNISVLDDVGNSVGTSVASPSGIWGADGTCGSADVTGTVAANSCDINFGTSSSYINYIIPANTSRVLSVRADIVSTADITTIRASLGAPAAANLEGQISFQTSTGGTATGNTMTVTSNRLTVAADTSLGTLTYVAGASNVKVAAFVLTATSAEGVKVSSLTFEKDDNDTIDLQNLKVMVGATQVGTTQAIVSNGASTMTFSGATPISVPIGGSVTVDLFADILTSSTTGTKTAVIDLNDGTAIGSASNSTVTWPTNDPDGQNLSIVGAPTVTASLDSSNLPASYMVMGSTENELVRIRFTVDDTEDTRITDIVLRDTLSGTTATGRFSLSNFKLYDAAGTLLAGPVSLTAGSDNLTTGTITFSLGNASPLIVKKNTSKTVVVKSDVSTVTAGAVSGQAHTISIPTAASVTAYGKDSSSDATEAGVPSGTARTVYRTLPKLSSNVLGAVSNRIRTATDEIANLNWSSDAAGDLIIGTVAIRFSGTAASFAAGSGITTFPVRLIDTATNTDWGSAAAGTAATQNCTPRANSCSVTFAKLARVDAATTKTVKLRINSSDLQNVSQQQDGFSATIETNTDIRWTDYSDQTSTGVSNNISWEDYRIPVTLFSVAYE